MGGEGASARRGYAGRGCEERSMTRGGGVQGGGGGMQGEKGCVRGGGCV